MNKLPFPFFVALILLIWIFPNSSMAQDSLSKGQLFFALSDIQPIGNTVNVSTLKPKEVKSFNINYKTYHSENGKNYIVKEKSVFTAQDGLIILSGIGDIAVTISGTEFLKTIPPTEITINSSYTVWQDEDGGFVLSTVNEDDMFFFRLVAQNIKLIKPFGDGSRICFKGEVSNFFEGYTFIGSTEKPLCFELSSKTGLTYKSGDGRVLKRNEVIKVFK